MTDLEQAQASYDAAVRDAEESAKRKGEAVTASRLRLDEAKRVSAAAIPVDRTSRTLADGSPVTDDHREINPATGQQKGYLVLSDAERAKGFVRPVRRTYVHTKCGVATTMGQSIAETYARDPSFYGGTFCVGCGTHFPLFADGDVDKPNFKWDDGTGVGT